MTKGINPCEKYKQFLESRLSNLKKSGIPITDELINCLITLKSEEVNKVMIDEYSSDYQDKIAKELKELLDKGVKDHTNKILVLSTLRMLVEEELSDEARKLKLKIE